MDDQYDWTAASGDFGIAANWEDVTTGANPAPNPPGSPDTAVFTTGGGTITGAGTVSTLDVDPVTAFTFAGALTTGTFDSYAPVVDTGSIAAVEAYLLDDLTVDGIFDATGATFGIAAYAGTLTIQTGAVVNASDLLEGIGTALLLQSGATLTLTGVPSNAGTAGLLGLDIEGVATIDDATLDSLSGYDVIGQTQTAGAPAQTADLTVQDGAKVQSDKTVIGATADETGTLTITGSLTDYTITANPGIDGADGDMIIGGSSQTGIANPGGTGDLILTDGATLTTDGDAILGLLPTGATATATGIATVGAGAIWNIGSLLLVADAGGSTGLLSIASGATVTASALDAGAVANAAGSVTVDGSGSTLAIGNTLVLAGSAATQGGTGYLAVTDGALVRAATLLMWNGATLSDDATGTVEIGTAGGAVAGDITVDAGVVATGAGTIEGTVIDNGTLTDLGTSLTFTGTELGSGTIRMGGAADLVLDAAQGIGGAISGFSTGQTIDLVNVMEAGVTLSYAGDTLTVTDGTVTANLDIGAGYTLADFSTLADGSGGTEIFTSQVMPCYLAGSRIRTTRGEIPVESLAPGDVAITASGRHAPIVWIGHRAVDCRRHPQPEQVMPVRIRAGAFGDAVPSRDLLLSPDHAVFAERVLIPVRCLLNGTTVVQERVSRAVYFHVELDRHDVLLAENLPAESFLEAGNRHQFANADGPTSLHADFSARARPRGCAPLVLCGTAVQRIRHRLRARAARTGGQPAPGLLVDGRTLRPASAGNGLLRFILPAGAREIRLAADLPLAAVHAAGRALDARAGRWRLPAARPSNPVVLELRLAAEPRKAGFRSPRGRHPLVEPGRQPLAGFARPALDRWGWSDSER